MEIEKKYLIKSLPKNLKQFKVKEIEQGYLFTNPVIRVRKSNDKYILTYKSRDNLDIDTESLCVANEIEMPITKDCYEHLREKSDGLVISKKRYIIPLSSFSSEYGELVAELDVFYGELEGLVYVEVEFESTNQAREFKPPSWFGEDVSDDLRYRNGVLSKLQSREEFLRLFK